MSSFKHKSNKLKYIQDVTTLDELHRNQLSGFDETRQSIPQKRRKLRDLNKELDSAVDLTERSKIMSNINTLEYEIHRAEEDTEYLEYVSKAGDLLINYYNITSGIYYNSEDVNEFSRVESSNRKQVYDTENMTDTETEIGLITEQTEISEFTETVGSKKKTKTVDKLKQLNELSKQSRKIKKPVKKRRIVQSTTVSRSILQFLPVKESQELQESQEENKTGIPKTEMILNRATLQHKYLMLVDKSYACGKVKADKVVYCLNCKLNSGITIEKILFQSEGCYVCEKCGDYENVIMESELPSHKELANEKQKYPYKKINHLKEKLNQFQSKESADVPDDICAIVKADLRKRKIDVNKCTPPIIRAILKKHKLTIWYEHLQQIYCKISGTDPITLPCEIEETIITMFQTMQESFRKHCPLHRSNFLSYSYVLNKLFKILKMPEHAKYFGLLKSKEKLREQDIIWAKICKDLEWKFYPSF